MWGRNLAYYGMGEYFYWIFHLSFPKTFWRKLKTPVVYKILCMTNGQWGYNIHNGFDLKVMLKSNGIIYFFKSLGSFRIYQLINTANPAQFFFDQNSFHYDSHFCLILVLFMMIVRSTHGKDSSQNSSRL